MKKDIDALSREHQHHMNRAEDITQEWYEYRLALTKLVKESEMGLSKTPTEGEMAPAFFLEVASNGVREETALLRKVRMHRRKAARLLKKLEKLTLKYPPEDFSSIRGATPHTSIMDEAPAFFQYLDKDQVTK